MTSATGDPGPSPDTDGAPRRADAATRPGRARRRLWITAAAACVAVLAGVAVLVLRLLGGASLDTSGITGVQITVFQSIPPPDTIRVSLETGASITAFDQLVQDHGIGVVGTSDDLVPGCAGGVMTTILLTRDRQAPTTLEYYSCGGTTGSNLTGDASGFISAVAARYIDCAGRGWGSQSVGSCPGA